MYMYKQVYNNIIMFKWLFFFKKITKEQADIIDNAISLVIKNNESEKLKIFLKDRRIDLDTKYLTSAAYKGHFEICELLLKDKRINPEYNNSALLYASQIGHTEIVRLFVRDGRFILTRNKNEALNEAKRFNHADIINILLTDYKVSMIEGVITNEHIFMLLKNKK